MRLEVRETAPPRGISLRIAFLHEAADPSVGAPAAVRGQVREACRVSGFRGREKETAGALTAGGGWVLVGLGRAGTPLGKVRRALRHALPDALRLPGRGPLLGLREGLRAGEMRAGPRGMGPGDAPIPA